MNNRDIIELCFKNLLRRRTRTFLAIIGVVVGTCAIVVMLSIGFGLTQSYQEQIESYGNLHMIQLYGSGGNSMPGQENKGVLNDKNLKAVGQIEGVTALTPVVTESMVLGIGKTIANIQIYGVDPDVLEKFNYVVEDGRLITSADKDSLLFGSQVPYWFYNPKSTMGGGDKVDVVTNKMIMTADMNYGQKPQSGEENAEKVAYKEYEVKGVGLLAETNDESAYSVYMNIERLEEIQKETRKARRENTVTVGEKTYNQALVYVGDINDAERVSKELKDLGYQAYSPIDWLTAMKDTAKMIQGILGGIGGISLLVAALGITNTMIMSIYERTKEIGVMKVIGSNLRDIRKMFLLEAGLIGFIGGVVGVVFSLIISLLMNTVLKDIISVTLGSFGGGYGSTISIVPVWLVFAAVAFSTAIGVIAGYSPAKRAMSLSALESLRNE